MRYSHVTMRPPCPLPGSPSAGRDVLPGFGRGSATWGLGGGVGWGGGGAECVAGRRIVRLFDSGHRGSDSAGGVGIGGGGAPVSGVGGRGVGPPPRWSLSR